MCLQCISTTEVVAANAMMAGGFGRHLVGCLRLRQRTPEQRLRHRQGIWDRNAAFLSGLGHDPRALLGPRPGDLRSEP